MKLRLVVKGYGEEVDMKEESLVLRQSVAFWLETPYSLYVDTNDSEEYTASNFRVKIGTLSKYRVP